MSSVNNSPPLVVHVIHSLGTGGLENGLIHIINKSSDSRYRHAIVCLSISGSFARRLEKRDVPVICLNRQAGNDIGLYWKIWKVLRKLKPAIVHTRNLSTLEAQIPAFFLSGTRTVHGVHGRDVFDLEGKNKKYNLLRRFIRPLVGRYIAVSRDLRDWLVGTIKVESSKVVQIYNGVDQSLFRPAPDKACKDAPENFFSGDVFVVGTVGRLAEVKDQATLIKAFGYLLVTIASQRAKLRLVIVGDGPMRGELDNLVSGMGLEDQIWMAGSRDDIPDLLRVFDVFVLPSLGEGVSNTVLEAMATALPVVATRVGGNPELIDHELNGFLVPRSDPKSLADSIEKLMTDDRLRRRMGQAGLKKVQDLFHWEKTVKGYLAVYDELLS